MNEKEGLMSTKPGSREWQENERWERWQIVRRYPPYQTFCESNPSGFNSEGLWDGLISREVEALMEQCGIEVIQHYDVDDCPPFRREAAIRYVFNITEDTGNPPHRHEEITPLWDSRSLRKKVRLDNSLDLPWKESVDSYGSEDWIETDRKFIVLRVDISLEATLSQLQGEFIDLVDQARELADIGRPRKSSSLDNETLRVWDLHRQGKSPKEIISEVWPDDIEKHEMYKRLKREYKKKGHKDYDEQARREVYGLSQDCGIVRKNVAVKEKIKQMQRLFKKYIAER